MSLWRSIYNFAKLFVAALLFRPRFQEKSSEGIVVTDNPKVNIYLPKTLIWNQPRCNAETKAEHELLNALAACEGLNFELAENLLIGKQVSSFIIDDYFEALDQQYQSLPVKSINSGFAKQCYFFESLKNPLKYVGLKKQLIDAKIIFWPICSGKPGSSDEHWYLLFFIKNQEQSYTSYCIDTLNKTTSHLEYFVKGRNLLTTLYPNIAAKDLIKKEESCIVFPQKNLVDCGPGIGAWAFIILQYLMLTKPTIEFEMNHIKAPEIDYSKFRSEIAHMLIKRTKKNYS